MGLFHRLRGCKKRIIKIKKATMTCEDGSVYHGYLSFRQCTVCKKYSYKLISDDFYRNIEARFKTWAQIEFEEFLCDQDQAKDNNENTKVNGANSSNSGVNSSEFIDSCPL